MKLLLIVVLGISFNVFAKDINHQYQDEYGDDACMIFHIKHDSAEVFELITKPKFFGLGKKLFRAVESFSSKKVSLEKENFAEICDKATRSNSTNTSTFRCKKSTDGKFVVRFRNDDTIESVEFTKGSKTYSCEAQVGPFDAR